MAEQKFSEFTEDTAPAITDVVVGLTGGDNKKMQIQNMTKLVQLDVTGGKAYAAGQLSYDAVTKTALADTGFAGVRVNVGQEIHVRFFNDTGVQIDNGKAVNAAGIDSTNDIVKGILADASSPATSSVVIGLATLDVPDQTIGVATSFGEVRGFDTSGLAEGGLVYLSETAGALTQTRPTYPSNIVIIGTIVKSDADGIAQVDPGTFSRNSLSSVYTFSSNNATSGTVYIAGSYDWPAADANLTQASTTQVYGTALAATGAHAAIVAGGAGICPDGVIGLRVNGDSFTDDGTTTIGDTETLSSDITALSTDEYLETLKNWSGQITFELFVVSGTPTTYSLDFNYGFSAYIDVNNSDFTIAGLRWEGICKIGDTAPDLTLTKHDPTTWTYAATGFTPGNGSIASWATDMAPNNQIFAGKNFKYKRANLDEFIEGSGAEGFLLSVLTNNNNSIQSATATVSGWSEELS